jgi:hypothetical protein
MINIDSILVFTILWAIITIGVNEIRNHKVHSIVLILLIKSKYIVVIKSFSQKKTG